MLPDVFQIHWGHEEGETMPESETSWAPADESLFSPPPSAPAPGFQSFSKGTGSGFSPLRNIRPTAFPDERLHLLLLLWSTWQQREPAGGQWCTWMRRCFKRKPAQILWSEFETDANGMLCPGSWFVAMARALQLLSYYESNTSVKTPILLSVSLFDTND